MMTKKILLIIIFFSILIHPSCIGEILGDSEHHVCDNYYVSSIDFLDKNRSLYYKLEDGNLVGVVDGFVSGVVCNENYIFVKQTTEIEDKYYIIPFKKKINKAPDENLYGPLDEADFKKKCNQFGVKPPASQDF